MNQPATCRTCQREDEKRQRELQADLERQAKRDQEQKKHMEALAELDRQIRLVREQVAAAKTAEENAQSLEQRKRDLEAAKRIAEQALNASAAPKLDTHKAAPIPSASLPRGTSVPSYDQEPEKSLEKDQTGAEETKLACEQEWDRQKRVDGVSNDAIDAIMGLTGLEDAKTKILNIKAKIETVLRQATDMKKERLGIVLLGNPGTGEHLR
jgi:DNA repair exonuclease SbcCD ATPase subunit